MKRMLVMHGPNLNLTGVREPGVYGTETLEDINRRIAAHAEKRGYACDFFQSNHEGAIIDRLHAARTEYDGVVLNAGAYTHYSYAIRDAIAAIRLPVIEVHLSNIHAREEFRHISYAGMACEKSFIGMGFEGYRAAIQYLTGKQR